jgi:Polyketide cyclase / dehydrase and lipid transport
MTENAPTRRSQATAIVRIGAAFAAALTFAMGMYLLIEATQVNNGLVGWTFLLILPAAISAFVAYVADPWAERRRKFYLMVPVWLLLAIIVASIFILREGVVCTIILAPLWMISGLIGAAITYRLRHKVRDGTTYASTLLLIPLMTMQMEQMIPAPVGSNQVTRSIIVDAAPDKIWPMLRGIPDVRPNEGRWNISQQIIGLPRPMGAQLAGNGIGADRHVRWTDGIKFRERVTAWEPGRRIGWRFIFDDTKGWEYTDRHLMPNNPYFTITTGGYRMEPMADGRTRVTLHTEYVIQTPVNAYSELWGQLFLGDVEDNVLAIIKARAETLG